MDSKLTKRLISVGCVVFCFVRLINLAKSPARYRCQLCRFAVHKIQGAQVIQFLGVWDQGAIFSQPFSNPDASILSSPTRIARRLWKAGPGIRGPAAETIPPAIRRYFFRLQHSSNIFVYKVSDGVVQIYGTYCMYFIFDKRCCQSYLLNYKNKVINYFYCHTKF